MAILFNKASNEPNSYDGFDPKKKAAQQIITDLKLTNQLVVNVLYKEALFKAMLKDYDSASQDSKVFTIVHLALAILEEVKALFKRTMTPECLFGTGINILGKIKQDIQATGRKGLSPQEDAQASSEMMKEYIHLHQHDLNMQDVSQKLLQMQKFIASGEYLQYLSKQTKVPVDVLGKEVGMRMQNSGVMEKQQPQGVMQSTGAQ